MSSSSAVLQYLESIDGDSDDPASDLHLISADVLSDCSPGNTSNIAPFKSRSFLAGARGISGIYTPSFMSSSDSEFGINLVEDDVLSPARARSYVKYKQELYSLHEPRVAAVNWHELKVIGIFCGIFMLLIGLVLVGSVARAAVAEDICGNQMQI